MNEARDQEWNVYFDKNFWAKSGKESFEQSIKIEKNYIWEDVSLYIPAIYVCKSGVIVDICKEVDSECVKQFIEKWNLYKEHISQNLEEDQIEQIQAENPLNWDVDAELKVNEQILRRRGSCGISWMPKILDEWKNDKEADRILEYYHLNPEKVWGIHRYSFEWTDIQPLHIEQIEITLSQRPVLIYGEKFAVKETGQKIKICNPINNQIYELMVMKYENNTLEKEHFSRIGKGELEYPLHFKTMMYTLEPDLDQNAFAIRDCFAGDAPRKRMNGKQGSSSVAAVAVIGGNSGPVSTFVCGSAKQNHVVCSSLHFQPVEQIEWKMGFYKIGREDITIKVME